MKVKTKKFNRKKIKAHLFWLKHWSTFSAKNSDVTSATENGKTTKLNYLQTRLHCIPSIKSNVYPSLNAIILKKQSSAIDPSRPWSYDTLRSAPTYSSRNDFRINHNYGLVDQVSFVVTDALSVSTSYRHLKIYLSNDERTFPTEKRFVKKPKLEAKFPHIIGHTVIEL